MSKKYSEVEELEQIRDRLVTEKQALEQRLEEWDEVRRILADSLAAERLELLSRVVKLEQRARALGHNIAR